MLHLLPSGLPLPAGRGMLPAGREMSFLHLPEMCCHASWVRPPHTTNPSSSPRLQPAAGFLTTLEEWLEAAVTARHISLFLAALTALQSLPLEAPLLRSSGCAGLLRMVRQLAKHPRKEVAAAAGELASQWQAVLQGGSAGLPTSSGQPAVKQEAEQQQQQTQQWWQQPEPLQQQQTQQAQQPEPLQRAHQQEQEQQTQTQRQTQPQTQQAQQAQRKRSRQEQHPQQHEGLQQPQQQPPANDPPGSKGPAACGPVSTDAAVGAAAGKAGKVPAAAGSSASKEGQAAPDEDLALKERPLFKKIVRTLHAAKKGGSGGAATAAGSTVTAHTASTAGAAGTAGTAGGAATPAAASGHAARTPRPVPAGTAGGSSAPPASAPASAAAAAAGASSGAAAKSDTHSMPAPTKPTESCQAADVKAQPLGKAVSAGWPPSQQQQTAGSAKRPRAEGESSSGGSRRSGQPPFPKRRQQQQHQSAGSQAPQHAQQGAQQPQQQLQAQVQWQPPPAFDLPAADDPVAFGEDSTEVAAMAAARALGQQLPDAAGCPAVQEEQAAVPGLPYVPTDAQDAQEQEQALRKAGWQPAV